MKELVVGLSSQEIGRDYLFTTTEVLPIQNQFKYYPTSVQQQIRTLLMMALCDRNTNRPLHPESMWCKLPGDIMLEILKEVVHLEQKRLQHCMQDVHYCDSGVVAFASQKNTAISAAIMLLLWKRNIIPRCC